MRQSPAAQGDTTRSPEGKSLFLRQGHGGFGTFLGVMLLTTELMEHGSKAQSKRQAKRVVNLPRYGHRLLALRQPLLRIPKTPQRQSGKVMAQHPRVLAIKQ